MTAPHVSLVAVFLLVCLAAPEAVEAQDNTRIVDGAKRFHRVYVRGVPKNSGEKNSWEDDMAEVKSALEKAGNQANGSTSQTLREPNEPQLAAAINQAFASAVPGDEVTLYFSGHGSGGSVDGSVLIGGETGEADNTNETFSLFSATVITDNDFANLIAGKPAGVTLVALFDSCYGGGFTGGSLDAAETNDIKIIGPRGSCPTDGWGIFGWYVDTVSEEIAAKANQGGSVSGTDVATHLTNEGFDVGPPTNGGGNKSKKNKCQRADGSECGGAELTEVMVTGPNDLMVSGTDFAPNEFVNFELALPDQTIHPLGSVMTDPTGAFMNVPLATPTTAEPFLFSAADPTGRYDWFIQGNPTPVPVFPLGAWGWLAGALMVGSAVWVRGSRGQR